MKIKINWGAVLVQLGVGVMMVTLMFWAWDMYGQNWG